MLEILNLRFTCKWGNNKEIIVQDPKVTIKDPYEVDSVEGDNSNLIKKKVGIGILTYLDKVNEGEIVIITYQKMRHSHLLLALSILLLLSRRL
jgi:hypothetical protein